MGDRIIGAGILIGFDATYNGAGSGFNRSAGTAFALLILIAAAGRRSLQKIPIDLDLGWIGGDNTVYRL